MRRLLKQLVAVAILIMISGCVLMPIISGFKDMGATPAARRELFQKAVKEFHDAIRMGDITTAMKFVTAQDLALKDQIKSEIRRTKGKEKIVSSEVDLVEFDDDAYYADVEVRTKYFEVPYYIVNEKLETEKWKFSTVGAEWRVLSRIIEPMKDGEVVRE